MKKKLILAGIGVILVLVIVGASALYGQLKDAYAPDQLMMPETIAAEPSPAPTQTAEPTSEPTSEPTVEPTAEPTSEPTVEPAQPTQTPELTPEPTVEPTSEPTIEPTAEPAEQAAATADEPADAHAPTASTKQEKEVQTVRRAPVAPDFTVYDAQGNEVHLSDFKGKPVVLNFWASFCGPCQMEMPHFNEKYLEIGDEVHFLMLHCTSDPRETQEKATDFIGKNGYSFPVYFDTTGQASSVYGAYSLPTTYFIDAQGYVITGAIGAIDAQTLQRGIDMIR